jgi:phytoene desaturase
LALKSLLFLWKIDAFRTMDAANQSFFKDRRMVQLFNRYATYNGSSPYKAPATLNIIPGVEYGQGGFAVDGGIYAIPSALKRLAEKKGVHFHLGNRVERIITREKAVKGIAVGGRVKEYPVVVSNADVLSTYLDLLDDTDSRWVKRYLSLEPSSSGVVFFWGVEGTFDELAVNNIFFSEDYQAEFSELFNDKTCPSDPTVYVNITSKVTPQDAPKECENWFVLVNAPFNNGQDWNEQVEATRQRVVRRLESCLGKPVEKKIVVEDLLTPPQIETNTGSSKGSLYGISSNNPLAAFLRHPNRVSRYKGLFMCGGSAHPGGGMPLVILSGKITADLVRRYHDNS